MKPILNTILLLFAITVYGQSRVDSLVLTKTEWTNTDLDYLRFDVDTITYNLAGKRHDMYYALGNKTITFEERFIVGGVDKRKEGVKFKIKQLDKDKLVLTPLDKKVNLDQEGYLKLNYAPFFKKEEYVFYNREKVASGVDFKRIASTCFGSCPSFSLEINRDGTVFYQGRIYTKEYTGNFTGIINDDEIYKLRRILNRTQFQNMVDHWEQQTKPVDTPRYNYIVELKNGEKLEVSTNDQHPILDQLAAYFIQIQTVAELKKSSKKHNFEKPKVNAYQIVGIDN